MTLYHLPFLWDGVWLRFIQFQAVKMKVLLLLFLLVFSVFITSVLMTVSNGVVTSFFFPRSDNATTEASGRRRIEEEVEELMSK